MKSKPSLEDLFQWLHDHPPAPLNPDFDPKAKQRWASASEMVEALEPFASRQDRARAWRQAYETLKAKGQ